MDNTVYVAYNWIGPTGPIENICTPDLYDLALVENQDMITVEQKASRAYPTEFGQRCADFSDRFKITGIAGMAESDNFIYPVTLGWKDDMQTLFDMENGIFERSRIPERALDLIRHHGGYLLLDQGWECFCSDEDFDLIRRYIRYHGIPENKTIYLTGTANVNEIYDKYCVNRGIQSDLNVVPYFPAMEGYAEYMQDLPEESEFSIFQDYTRKFLSLNYRPRPHRTMLLALFNKTGLINDSHFSFCGMHDDQHIGGTYQNHHLQGLGLEHSDIDQIQNKLPELVLDNAWPEYYNDVLYDQDNPEIGKYYSETLVNITTETNFYSDIISVTEKSFKPMRYCQAFIILGAPGTLKNLRDLGFRTFSDIWDESYDLEPDHSERLKKVMEICKQIHEWDHNQISKFRNVVKLRIDYNYKLLREMSAGSKPCTYQTILDTVIKIKET